MHARFVFQLPMPRNRAVSTGCRREDPTALLVAPTGAAPAPDNKVTSKVTSTVTAEAVARKGLIPCLSGNAPYKLDVQEESEAEARWRFRIGCCFRQAALRFQRPLVIGASCQRCL